MKRSGFVLFLVVAARIAVAADVPRERVSLNSNWRFTKGDPATLYRRAGLVTLRGAVRYAR